MTRRTLVVNFLGGPGSGKSVLAAETFAALKKAGHSAELIQEYAKDLTWGEDWETLGNQAYVTSKQFRRQCRVDGKIDFIVTDTSLLLGAVYRGRGCGRNFDKYLVEDLYGEFWNLNIWVNRGEGIAYEQAGRKQNEEQSAEKADLLRKFLNDWKIAYQELKSGPDALDKAMVMILNHHSKGRDLLSKLPQIKLDFSKGTILI